MNRPAWCVLALLPSLAIGAAGCAEPPAPGRSPGIERYGTARDLHAFAEAYRTKHRLPALGVGIVQNGRVVGLGMAGERAVGTSDWATVDDAFDVASCTKSVTATIAAMLVEEGVIRWDTTVGDAFPAWKGRIDPGYQATTLDMLLRHRGGLDHTLNSNDRWRAWYLDHAVVSSPAVRELFAQASLERPPHYPPGSRAFYTSDGFVVAGSMLERAAGLPWEELVRTRLFEPLGLTSMGYGVTAPRSGHQRVSGHEAGWFGATRTVTPDPSEYGPHPFGSPAGFLYASVPDLLRYIDFHIQGARGQRRLLSAHSFRLLHTASDGEHFALGWESEVVRDAQGRVVEHSVFHGGYSGRSRANLWFSPETGWGTVIVANHGRGDEAITTDIFYALLREYGLLAAHR